MNQVSSFVLIGGQSRRMGRDKTQLDWAGGTLLDHMVGRLSAVADSVAVVGGSALPDREPGMGPLGGIRTGLEKTSTEMNLFVATDLPFLTVEFLGFFRRRAVDTGADVIACHIDSKVPLCLGVQQKILPQLDSMIQDSVRSVRRFVEASKAQIIRPEELIELGFDPDIFRDLHTPGEYLAGLGAQID
jgi:molybdopterin-guanine dinucleotide biosynthesis protein A